MAVLKERIDTTLTPDEAFAFVADFANAAEWDPGVATSRRLTSGPVGVGTRYRLGVRMGRRTVSMDYRITAFEPIRRVVLEGAGGAVEAVDEIRFEPTAIGTRIDYTADIRLRGPMRLVAPFAGEAFRRIGRDAREGMQRALDRRASGA